MENGKESRTVARLSEIVGRVVGETGMDVVEIRCAGGRKVSVFVDKPGGVNIGECADLSREIGVLIDIEQVMGSGYTLEVSSPGPERPLVKRSDYDRFGGRRAKIRTKEPLNGRKVFIGRINGTEKGFLKLSGEEMAGGVFSIPFDDIEKANLKREF